MVPEGSSPMPADDASALTNGSSSAAAPPPPPTSHDASSTGASRATTTSTAVPAQPSPISRTSPTHVVDDSAHSEASPTAGLATATTHIAAQPNGEGRSPSSSAMSHQNVDGYSARQPGSYSSSTHNSYASPSAAPPPAPYSYGTSSAYSSAEAYRASPGTQVSLPSVRSFDSPPQQQAPQSVGMPMSMPMPQGQSMPYYNSMAIASDPYSLPSDPSAVRYAMASHADPRFGVGPRGPKKEIKRRTKTGCLTCRKRRIKCDEAQPSCNNCKKSKRDCLGYDPIFKPQTGPSNQHATNSVHQAATPTPTLPSSVPSAPSHSLATNPYGHQPAVLPSSYGATGATGSFDNSFGTAASIATSTSTSTSTRHPVSARVDEHGYSQTIEPTLHSLPTLTPSTYPGSSHQAAAGENLHLRGTKMQIDQVISLLGPSPEVPSVTLTDDLLREIIRVYHEVYVLGLSSFFETSWYQHKDQHGSLTFPSDHNARQTLQIFASFLKVIETTQVNDRASMLSSGVLEAKLVWSLSTLPYSLCPQGTNSTAPALPVPGDDIEARNRAIVFETLLSGDYLSVNPLARPMQDQSQHRTREFHFWYALGDYLCLRVEPGLSRSSQREEVLGRLRHLLDGRENRDLLYSIAIVRELAPQFPPGYEQTMPQHLDEADAKNKLFVASDFIKREAQVTGGTTNVVRRFSEIAVQALIQPGVNVAKPLGAGP